jgi:hypothetical protein
VSWLPALPRAQRALVSCAVAGLAASGTLRALGGATPLAGVLLLLCASFAPGLLCTALVDRDGRSGLARTLLLSVALSPVVLTAVSAALFFGAGVPLPAASVSTLAATALGLLGLWGASLLRGVPAAGAAPAERPWLALGPALLAAGMAALVFSRLGNRISFHGVLHAGLVAQIFAGVVPPENPALAGEPLEFYWLYHWLLAVLTQLDGFSILLHGPWLSALSLFVYVGESALLARRFLGARDAAAAALALGFVANLCFPLVFAAQAARHGLPDAPFWPFSILQVGWLAGDPRLLTTFGKFLAVSGFPVGLALWAVLLDELTPRPDHRPRAAVLLLGLWGTIALHTTTALAVFPALAAAHFALGPPGRGRPWGRGFWRHNGPTAAVFAAAVLLAAPYLLSVTGGSQGAAVLQPPRPGVLRYNLAGLATSATPLLPLVAFAAWRGWREPAVRFLVATTAVLLVAGVLLELPDNNQYKILHVAALPGGALLFWILGRGGALAGARRVAFAATVALCLAGHAIAVAAHLATPSSRRSNFTGEGGYLAEPGQPALDGALHWLRSHSPGDAAVVSGLAPFGGSSIAAVSGRNAFVLLGGHHTQGKLEFALRARLAQALFSPDRPAAPLLDQVRAALPRPLYVLLWREQFPDDFEALRRKLDAQSQRLTPVYRSGDALLYRLGAASGRGAAARSEP